MVAISVSAEETIYYSYALFAENTDTNSIQLNMLHLTVNDDITTNDTFSSTVFNSTINGEIVDKLDHDDITSYGLETVAIIVNSDLNGVYRYSVHNYTN